MATRPARKPRGEPVRPCQIPGCVWVETTKASDARKNWRAWIDAYGWVCHGHHGRHRKGLDMTVPFRKYQPIPDGQTCDVEGCDLLVIREGYKPGQHYEGYGYACSQHVARMQRTQVWGGDVRPTKRQESYTLKRVRAALKLHGAKLVDIPTGDLDYRTRLNIRCLECGEKGTKSIVKVCNTADAIKASTTPRLPNGNTLGEGICAPCGKRKSTEVLWGEEGLFGSWADRATAAIAEVVSCGWDYIDNPYPGVEEGWTLRHRECGRPYETSLQKIRTAHKHGEQRSKHPGANQGCPRCSGVGYDKGLPGTLYLIRRPGILKIGITNTKHFRLDTHKAHGWKVVRTWLDKDGKVPQDLERQVLHHWRENLNAPRALAEDDMPQGGWSETAPTRKVGLKRTIDYIDDLLQQAA